MITEYDCAVKWYVIAIQGHKYYDILDYETDMKKNLPQKIKVEIGTKQKGNKTSAKLYC